MKRKYLNNKSLCAAVFLYMVFSGGLFASDNKKMDDYFCNEIKKPFFKIGGKNKDGAIIIPGRSQGRDFSFIMPKPKGVKRIFIIGESVAGLMYWQIPLVKDSIKNPEIVNCGMGAYESGRILDVFIEIMDYEPDLIVVLSGNNEMVGDPCRGIAAEMRRRLRMIKINAKRIFSGLKMKESEYFINIKTHEERLRKMVKIAREKKVPVVLCTLPANMKDFSPFGSLPFEIKNFAKAYFLMETGHYKKAKKIFEAILTENPKEPFNHFYLAKILESLGKFNEAKRHYELAIEWDNRMDRSSKERNKMIREVTKEEGACLADLEKSFMDVSKNKIIGGDLIVDGVHWFGKHNDFVISQALKFMEKCDNAGAMFKKNKISKLKKMNFGDFKEEDDNKKEALEMFYYGIAFLTNEMKSGKINERALMIFERAYEADKNLIYDASKSKESLRKYIKENFWTKEIMNPVSVGVWRPDFLHHIAELFRRKGKLNKAKKNIDKALKLAPKELRFSLTRRLILKGMEKNVSAGDLNEVVLSYNSDLLRKEHHRLQGEEHKLHSEKRILKNEKKKLKFRKSWQEKHKELSKISYIKESKKAADKAIKKYMAGDIKSAKSYLKQAIAINPNSIEAQITMCSINMAQKKFNEALKYCDNAIYIAEFPPKHVLVLPGILADTFLMRAEIYGNIKEYKKAERDLKKTLREAPKGWSGEGKAKKMLTDLQEKKN